MIKSCKQCGGNFEVSDDDLAYLQQIAPVYGGKKYQIPPPDFCPLCRLQRRMCFRNERSLYQRKCDGTGKNIISCYAPGTDYIVYEHDYWWSDKWNGLSFGRNFDFGRTLTEQLKDLNFAVPHSALITTNCVNCDYTNYFLNSKNCYLCFGGSHNENVMYGKFVVNCKNVVDGLSLVDCEMCYQGNSSQNCYGCKFFLQSRNCSDCLMIEECLGCRNCIACFGLRNKEYCFLNEYVGKEKFEKLSQEYKSLSHSQIADLRDKLEDLKADLPHPQWHIYASDNCSGDVIMNSKNCKDCFSVRSGEDCQYVAFSPLANHCRDEIFSAPGPTEFCYQVCSIVGNSNSMALFMVWSGGSNLYYCMECHSCSDCFACVGLKNKQYCVLNKQYTKVDYEALVGRIIEHMRASASAGGGANTAEWGQFLDPQLACYGVNESVGFDYFQITKEQALEDGFKWRDEEIKKYKPANYVISERIEDIGDEVKDAVLACEKCGKNYKIIAEELKFYKLTAVPLPKHCFDCRHMDRISHSFNFRLHERKCAKCGNEMQAIYGSERKEKVCCEACYLKEVY